MEISANSDQFGKLPLSYQRVAMFYGFVANDLSIFRRLLILSMNTALSVRNRPRIYRVYTNAQTFALLRVLAGKTLEAWESIKKEIDGIRPLRDLVSDIDSYAPGVRRKCGAYFGQENALYRIRNGFAFHMDPAHWSGESTVDIDASAGLECFVRDRANSLYATSESVLLLQMMASLGHRVTIRPNEAEIVSDLERFGQEWQRIVDEITEYGGMVADICDGIVFGVFEEAERKGVELRRENHVIRDAVPANAVRIPVFIKANKPSERQQ
jgi:hypothetical protein